MVTTLPDRDVTISLPGSLRASVDRDIGVPDSGLARSGRSSSVEIFNGVYEMKVPRPSKVGSVKNVKAEVEEIYSDHVIMRGAKDKQDGKNEFVISVENGLLDVTLVFIVFLFNKLWVIFFLNKSLVHKIKIEHLLLISNIKTKIFITDCKLNKSLTQTFAMLF